MTEKTQNRLATIGAVVLGILVIFLISLIPVGIIMLAWNLVIVDLFDLPRMAFWQALLIAMLIAILRGGGGAAAKSRS